VRSARPWAAGLFLLSGATALVYEVLWSRWLTLVLGHSAAAVGMVLAAFMAGLALGAALAGRGAEGLSPRLSLALYGTLEVGIALFALASPGLIFALRDLVAGQGAPLPVKGPLMALVLVPPTAMMGATLPLVCRALAGQEDLGAAFPLLYGLNTLGATLGAFLAGFLALPWLGQTATLAWTAATNGAVGALALALARRQPGPHPATAAPGPGPRSPGPRPTRAAPGPDAREPDTCPEPGPFPLAAALACAALAGAAAMAYEVAFTRVLTMILGSSVYGFSMVLTLFLVGIGLGSLLARRARPHRRDFAFGWAQVAMAAAALGALLYIPLVPGLFVAWFPQADGSFPRVLALQFCLATPVLLLPALCTGLALPLLQQVAAPALGRLGLLYAANTLGCIAGSTGAGLVLLGRVGAEGTLAAGIACNLVAAALALPWTGRPALPALALAALAGASLLRPSWDPRLLAGGAGVYAALLARTAHGLEAPGELLFYKDGLSTTVSVHRLGSIMYLRVNGKTDASTGQGDMATQLMLGHLPVLYHPRAHRAGIVGLGSGITAGAVAAHPGVREIEVAELEPAVLEAARFFAPWNAGVLDDPRLVVTLDDGRNHLLESRRSYDILSVEPSNPWIAGIGSLFTEEFYRLCRQRLAPGGVLCHWIHLRALDPRDLRMVLATFARVFPRGQMWLGGPRDLLLLGFQGQDPGPGLPARLQAAWNTPRVRADLVRLGVEAPGGFYGRYLGAVEDLAGWLEGADLNTDDRPLLEFRAPLSLYRQDQDRLSRAELFARKRRALPGGEEPSPGQVEEMIRTARANGDEEMAAWLQARRGIGSGREEGDLGNEADPP
jgi:spermidine synthase